MPYDGEFAGYRPLQRIVETERVQSLLRKSRVFQSAAGASTASLTRQAPQPAHGLPSYVVAIDGSNAEVDVKNGYPGAKVGYCTVASVLLNLSEMSRLDEQRPVDPLQFRKTEEASTVDAALPGCNVVTRNHTSACDSFRESLYEVLQDVVVDIEEGTRLLDTMDGPLAIFGHPAWLSAAISRELKRLNAVVRAAAQRDLLILGIEKTGTFVGHFDEIDKAEDGSANFASRTFMLPTDKYIKDRIIFSTSTKRYGLDTYFGRKLFYKTASGARIVADIPFLNDDQDSLETDDISLYAEFGSACALLDALASSRFPNSVSPLISAHAQAAIPLRLGTKVLQQLAKALMRQE